MRFDPQSLESQRESFVRCLITVYSSVISEVIWGVGAVREGQVRKRKKKDSKPK